MHNYIAFDLDGTLAKLAKSTPYKAANLIRRLEKEGKTIIICSGKPLYYLCGYARQLGLNRPVLIGENGATLQVGIDLPPKQSYRLPVSEKALLQLKKTNDDLRIALFDKAWFQPNEVGVTPFPYGKEGFDIMADYVKSNDLNFVDVYTHSDCYDFSPKGISKYSGLEFYSEISGAKREEFIAVGDWTNDIGMFEFADLSFCIGNKMKDKTDKAFKSITECLSYLVGGGL